MSMHLAVGLTTTSTKKRKEKPTKAQQEQLERDWRDRNQRLKQMGLPKQTYEQFLEWVYGKGKKEKTLHNNTDRQYPTSPLLENKTYASKSKDAGARAASFKDVLSPSSCTKKPTPTYTGEKIIGIVVMHKSCLQPVFTQ